MSKTPSVVRREVSSVDAENVEDVILQAAWEASNKFICNEALDDLASVFEKSSHADMKDAGVVLFS